MFEKRNIARRQRDALQQIGTPQEVYGRPANRFVAGFLGQPPMNFIRGRFEDGAVAMGGAKLALPASVSAAIKGSEPEVLVGLRPESFVPTQEGAGLFRGEIEVVEQLGAESYVYLRVPNLDVVEQGDRPVELAGSICARLNEPTNLIAGERVSLDIRPELVRFFDMKTGDSRLKR